MSEADHQRCLELFRERTALQRKVRGELARIQEIETKIRALSDGGMDARDLHLLGFQTEVAT